MCACVCVYVFALISLIFFNVSLSDHLHQYFVTGLFLGCIVLLAEIIIATNWMKYSYNHENQTPQLWLSQWISMARSIDYRSWVSSYPRQFFFVEICNIRSGKLYLIFISAWNHAKFVLQLAKHFFINRKCQNLSRFNSRENFWHLARIISNNFLSSFFPPLLIKGGGNEERKLLEMIPARCHQDEIFILMAPLPSHLFVKVK